ncbi:uncharacterized protein F4807DRAFT_387523 [Annulohypoxylon truncatum]|uniref:uncharacterized protein n=1 Tax=Annulohypoxylon truncatum TaxID=327061 RepID=UPI0020075C64|nr:uncharacterized protein F4807DRAFT_387523 [Annulohypoxylon truncatum]KAI1212084.1 hypothetical protein F4807DRAFT_387523 [Annulohypoxylon truncatum]
MAYDRRGRERERRRNVKYVPKYMPNLHHRLNDEKPDDKEPPYSPFLSDAGSIWPDPVWPGPVGSGPAVSPGLIAKPAVLYGFILRTHVFPLPLDNPEYTYPGYCLLDFALLCSVLLCFACAGRNMSRTYVSSHPTLSCNPATDCALQGGVHVQ